jgi:DNA-binding PucR family transcriptional regulator
MATGDDTAQLGDVVEDVGGGILDVLAAPKGLDVPVGETVILDPSEDWVGAADDILLAVGVDPRHAQAADVLRRAGEAGVAAVVLKARPGAAAPDLADAAREAGVALLLATPEVAWGQLHALLRTAAAAAGLPPDRAPGGVPIGDLFALANAVAAMVGGPVTIEDPRSTVLAYSSHDTEIDEGRRATILGRRVPDEWIKRLQDDGVFRRLARERGVVRLDYAELGIRPRLATAIRAGDEILGTIWVQEADRPLQEEAEVALLEAAGIAALHLLRHRSGADLERGRRAELLRAALDGRAAPEALAPVLQIAPTTPLTIVAFEPVERRDPAASSALADRVASLVTLYCESYRRPATAVAVGPVVYLLTPTPDAEDRARLPAFAGGVIERAAEALQLDLRAAVGATVPALSALVESRQEADRVLRALAASPAVGPVATVDVVRARVVLQRLQELAARDAGLRAGKLEVLLAHDRDKGTEYVATLRAYFAALGDVPVAAAAQGVHANTFRYRLRRLAEVAGLDLDDPVERLVVQLQLHF